MKVLESQLMKRYARMAMDGFNQGWHERNGGNLSYRMKPEEVGELKEDFNENAEWRVIGWQAGDESEFPGLAGEYFMVSGSGKYFRNVELDPEDSVCIIQLNEAGNRYRIVWGLVNGGMPTSELPTHLANLEVCKARDPKIRVVYHCHPTNTIALTFVLPLDSRVFTREIFEMVTECAVVFPEGIGIVPWVICGGRQIGEMTAEIMKKQDVAVWAHHGAFCCGYDFDLAFGLMHTVEKAAEVLVKVLSMSQYKLNTITPEMFRQLNEPFGIQINEDFLYEKKDGRIGQLPED
ncbi:MAG: rhamnulose-1-phosphate aldolase [Lachnospiraceae bacterium]|nr:rhamnulose-1-phosphate aldolase [Lachnospiraceae bacterium]